MGKEEEEDKICDWNKDGGKEKYGKVNKTDYHGLGGGGGQR